MGTLFYCGQGGGCGRGPLEREPTGTLDSCEDSRDDQQRNKHGTDGGGKGLQNDDCSSVDRGSQGTVSSAG